MLLCYVMYVCMYYAPSPSLMMSVLNMHSAFTVMYVCMDVSMYALFYESFSGE